MIDLVIGYVQVSIALIAVIAMVLTYKKFFNSGIKLLMLNITGAYFSFGISTIIRLIINLTIGHEAFGDPVYDLLIGLNYGIVFLAFAFAIRAVHYAGLISKGFGDINYARKGGSKSK